MCHETRDLFPLGQIRSSFSWDFRLLNEFTASEMGVGVGGGSREKVVRHLARVFKSPISLHKDQLSSLREGKSEEVPYPRLFSFRSPTLEGGRVGKYRGNHLNS